jgi:hypothetical protein
MSPHLNDPRHPWTRLTTAARHVADDRDTTAPYGFATRIAALAFAQERAVASLFERFALRAVGVASLLALCSVVVNYEVLTSRPAASTVVAVDETEALPTDDAVAIVLELAD